MISLILNLFATNEQTDIFHLSSFKKTSEYLDRKRKELIQLDAISEFPSLIVNGTQRRINSRSPVVLDNWNKSRNN